MKRNHAYTIQVPDCGLNPGHKNGYLGHKRITPMRLVASFTNKTSIEAPGKPSANRSSHAFSLSLTELSQVISSSSFPSGYQHEADLPASTTKFTGFSLPSSKDLVPRVVCGIPTREYGLVICSGVIEDAYDHSSCAL